MLTLVRFPTAEADVAGSIPPPEVLFNRLLLCFMGSEIGIVQGEFAERRKVTFDPIQPRSVAGREVESDAMLGCPVPDLGLQVIAGVIQYHIQRAAASVASAKPAQKVQELDPVLAGTECPEQSIGLEIVSAPHVSHATVAVVSGPVPLHPLAGAHQAPTSSRLQIERPELIDADHSAAGRRMLVQASNRPIFGPEFGIGGVLPGLGVPPLHFAFAQDLMKATDADRGDNLLFDEISPQLGKRPAVHADQGPGRGQGDLDDLLGGLSKEPAWTTMTAVVGTPCDAIEPGVVEPMADDPHPLRRTVDPLGDLPVGHSAHRQQDDASVTTIDSVRTLTFHAVQLEPFIRLELPCSDRIHCEVSVE